MFDIFSDFFDGFEPFEFMTTTPTVQSTRKCPKCGHTWSDFRRTGRFGCSECYNTFRSEAAATIRQIHSTTRHTGKVPSKAGAGISRKREYENLKAQLQKAVSSEDYEKAAKLHKRIREMEKEGI
jgi:protein arginine kinase activator